MVINQGDVFWIDLGAPSGWGGNSLGGPAILHTSSNAPMLILALPPGFVATALLPHS